MEDGEKQIGQMVSFILHEAKQKAAELESKAREEFNITKMQIVKDQREKIRKEFGAKQKRLETQQAIARSTAINNARLKRVTARTEALDSAMTGVKQKLQAITKDPSKYKELITSLIVQGSLKVLEDKVQVRCRQEDRPLVQSAFAEAERAYSTQIKRQTGVERKVALSIDTGKSLLSKGKGAVIGGVVLCCHGGLITVDNTLDSRLRLVEEQDKPAIRQMMFPAGK